MGLFSRQISKTKPGYTPTNRVGGGYQPVSGPKDHTPPKSSSAVGLFIPKRPTALTVDLDSESQLFYSTDLGFTLYSQELKQGTVLKIGERIPVACMFEVRWLLLDGRKIGYLFNSQFQVTNKGGYIMTYMNSGAGKASAVEVLVKTDTLVVYHFPNHGTLVISPYIGNDIQNILEEQ